MNNVSLISFSGAKKQKKNNIVRNNDEQVKVSVPQNYKIVINPNKEKLVMTPQIQEDEFVSSETNESSETEKTSTKNKKIKEQKNTQNEKETAKSSEKSVIEKAKKITRIVMAIIMTALSALGLKEGKDMLDYEPEVSSAVVDFDSKENDISDIANTYNIDEHVIRYSNGIYSDEDLSEVNSLKIPTQYDYMSDVIDEKTQKLYKAEPYSSEYYNISKELDALIKKQKEQEAIADVYSDGETVYISLKEENENPDLAKKFEGNFVPVDYIEKLFDIKDGELHKYNTFVSARNNQWICLGTTIKIPVTSIDTDNIDLSDYLK